MGIPPGRRPVSGSAAAAPGRGNAGRRPAPEHSLRRAGVAFYPISRMISQPFNYLDIWCRSVAGPSSCLGPGGDRARGASAVLFRTTEGGRGRRSLSATAGALPRSSARARTGGDCGAGVGRRRSGRYLPAPVSPTASGAPGGRTKPDVSVDPSAEPRFFRDAMRSAGAPASRVRGPERRAEVLPARGGRPRRRPICRSVLVSSRSAAPFPSAAENPRRPRARTRSRIPLDSGRSFV